MTRAQAAVLPVVLLAALAALAAGCSGHDRASPKTPAATPPGYAQIQQKVNAAESAAAAADRDAASNTDH